MSEQENKVYSNIPLLTLDKNGMSPSSGIRYNTEALEACLKRRMESGKGIPVAVCPRGDDPMAQVDESKVAGVVVSTSVFDEDGRRTFTGTIQAKGPMKNMLDLLTGESPSRLSMYALGSRDLGKINVGTGKIEKFDEVVIPHDVPALYLVPPEEPKKASTSETFLTGTSPINVEAIEVTAADYANGAWDGSPFKYEGSEVPHWLSNAIKDGLIVQSKKVEYDYAVWEVRTDNDAIFEAWPGDWIVHLNGHLSVVQHRIVKAFKLSGMYSK